MQVWALWLALLALATHPLGAHGFLQFLSPQKPAPQIVGHFATHFGVPRTEHGAQRYVPPRFQRFIRADQDVKAKTSTALVSATESGTYGALNPRDGGIVWRRSDKLTVQGLYSFDDTIVTLSGPGGQVARAVLGKTGELLWETLLDNRTLPLDTPGVHATGDANDLVVVSNARDVRRIRMGHIAWHWAPDEAAVHIASTVVTREHVYVVGAVRSGKAYRPRIYVLSQRGTLEATHTIDKDLAHGKEGLLLLPWAHHAHFPPGLQVQRGGPHVAFLGTDHAVHAVRLDDAAPRKTVQHVRARGKHRFTRIQDVGLGDRGFFVAIREDHASEVVQVDQDGRLHSAWEFDEGAEDAVYEGVFDRSGHAYILRVFFTTSQQLLNQHIFWADARTGQELGQVTGMSYQFDHDLHGNVLAAPFEVGKLSPFQLMVRVALITSSGAVHLIQDGEHQWVLEEGLAEKPRTLLVALPDRSLGTSAVTLSNERHAYDAPLVALEHESLGQRLLRHTRLLAQVPSAVFHWVSAHRGGVDWLASLLIDDTVAPPTFRQPTAGGARVTDRNDSVVAPREVPAEAHAELFSDAFGFRKVIVAATPRGKVYGIETTLEGSRLLWQRSLVGYGRGEGAPEPKVNVTHLVQTRATGAVVHGVPVTPLVAVVAQITEPGRPSESRLFELNPLTGETMRDTRDGAVLCPGAVHELVMLPVEAPDTHTLGAVCSPETMVVYPPAHALLSTLQERLPRMHLGTQEGHAFQGHVLRHVGKAHFHAVPTWRWPLSSDEEVLSVLDRSSDPIASLGRVAGDRSVLYKYLNPHGRLVTTYTPAQQTVDVYLIDQVTGALAYHLRIPHVAIADGVRTTFVENWITVQYATNQTAEGSEPQPPPEGNAPPWYFDSVPGFTRRLVSIELYEPEATTASNASSLATGIAGPVASYALPVAHAQSFLLPYGVQATGITRTTLGVTTKGLLVATDRENIVLIPRTVLDPRRPLGKPTAKDMEEGLRPYVSEIPDEPNWHLTRTAYRVMEVQSLSATPSLLESSSMVLGVGLDWMYTMASPSGQFDRLQGMLPAYTASFNKLQLVLTIAGLLVGILISNPLVRARRLAARW